MADTNPLGMMTQRLAAELKADKKKASILGILLVVALVVGVRVLVKTVTSSANAAPVGPVSALTVHTPQAVAARPATTQTKRDEYIKSLDTTITRDIFVFNPRYYPLQKTVDVVKVLPTSAPAPAEDTKVIHRQMIQAQARALVLESTMVGSSAVAIINGKVLRVGESLAGFKIVEITSSSCTVMKEDVTLSLAIKK